MSLMKQDEMQRLTRLRLKAKFFKGLADSTRLSIFEALRDGDKTVTEIGEITKNTQSNISNHLMCLRECGLLDHRKEGKNVYYFIVDKAVLVLLADADRLIAGVVEKLHKCMIY